MEKNKAEVERRGGEKQLHGMVWETKVTFCPFYLLKEFLSLLKKQTVPHSPERKCKCQGAVSVLEKGKLDLRVGHRANSAGTA